jgi:hypothetical protein
MRPSLHRADLVAFAILAILVSVVGTGIGVAAAHVRASGGGGTRPAPLRAMFPNAAEVPSLQRDRAHLRPRPR